MGLFNNIKNYVTGGAADVRVIVKNDSVILGSQIDFEILVTPTSGTIAADKVYITIKAVEQSGDHYTLYQDEQVLDTNIQLMDGETKRWSATFSIPADGQATYLGRHSRMQWLVYAGVDMAGKDPTSDSVVFMVNNTN
jgi:sporulation-control protein spo0M